jgi:hypothetical protein
MTGSNAYPIGYPAVSSGGNRPDVSLCRCWHCAVRSTAPTLWSFLWFLSFIAKFLGWGVRTLLPSSGVRAQGLLPGDGRTVGSESDSPYPVTLLTVLHSTPVLALYRVWNEVTGGQS